MLPAKWGGGAWDYFHCITLDYPKKPSNKDKLRYKNFFHNIILPCCICDSSYHFFIKEFPPDDYLNDRNGIVFWLYTLHNMVNAKLGKKSAKFSDVIHHHEKMRVDYTNSKENLHKIDVFIANTVKNYKHITIQKLQSMMEKNKKTKVIKMVTKNK